jgi:CO/xanthine dehydrogenase FAD-binding subunit
MVNTCTPCSLKEALRLLHEKPLIPYAGGTELMIQDRPDAEYLFLMRVPELRTITADEQYVHIGAAVTFSEALKSPLIPDLMKEAVSGIGSPAIRNAGTFGGNLANGSDKADSVLIEFVSDAEIVLASFEGERTLAIDRFHRGRKDLDLRPDELIHEIRLPRRGLEHYSYCKVGGRHALAITFVSFAGVFEKENGRITKLAAAFGAAGDSIQRYKDIESMMLGLTADEAMLRKQEYLSAYEQRLKVNVSRVGPEYQKYTCMKLLEDFFTKAIG